MVKAIFYGFNIKKNKNNNINRFSIEINNTINLYSIDKRYKPPIFTKVKALANFYVEEGKKKLGNNINLITNKELKEIFIKYKKKYLPNNNVNYILDMDEDINFNSSLDNEDDSKIDNVNKELRDLNINEDNETKNINSINIINEDDNNKEEFKYFKNIQILDFRYKEGVDKNINSLKNKAIKRKKDGIDINEEIKNNEFENNMYLYDTPENYFLYLINCYNTTLTKIKKNKDNKIDIKKLENFIRILEDIKLDIIDNHLEGKQFNKVFIEFKNKYKKYDNVFKFIF